MDQELADAAAYAPGRRCVCTHQIAPLFCVKWRHGHGRRLEHIYLKNNPAEWHPDPSWKDGLKLSEEVRVRPIKTTTRWAAILNQFLV